MVTRGSAWRKNNWRELRRTKTRFLAIFAIVALGVGFFVGLKLARPAMVQIGREFVADSNLYDYQLVSTIGLTEEDRAYFAGLDGVTVAEGSITADLLTELDGKQTVFKTHQLLDTLDQLKLTAGRMPKASNECLLDDLVGTEALLGTRLPVYNDEGHLFSQEGYTVVGLCSSAQYLNVQRGTTALGSGSVSGFLYIPAGGYESEVYTEIYLKLNDGHDAFTEEYDAAMSDWEQPLTDAMEQRGELRREQVWQDAQTQLDESWAEYEDGLAEYQQARADVDAELADAKRQLDEGRQQLDDARAQLEEGEETYAAMQADPYSNEELASARKALDDGWAKLQSGEAQYRKGKQELEAQKAEAQPQLADARRQLDEGKQQLDAGWAEYWDGYRQLENNKRTMQVTLAPLQQSLDQAAADVETARRALNARQQELDRLLAQPDPDPAALAAATAAVQRAQAELAVRQTAYEAAKNLYDSTMGPLQQQLTDGEAQLAEGKQQLDAAQKQYDDSLAEYEAAVQALADGEAQLADAAAQLAWSRRQLEQSEQDLTDGIETALEEGREQLDDSWAQLEQSEADYAQSLADYESGVAEADAEFADSKQELDDAEHALHDAQKQVDLLKNPSYYALNRKANSGYSSFDNDTMIVDGVARVFPIFFFLVAALVCSSTMTRMVEEQRTQNGTLKALGYTDGQIMWRYASYAGSAALLGGLTGYLLCAWLFPLVIWHAYQMLYHFGEIRLLLDGGLAVISLLFALLCSVGPACAAVWSDMRQMPAQLMRPKAPRAGKRILLERIRPLWSRLSFLHKVTARNIFRYKKRMIMMVLGVGGCMALLLAGLGMRDTITTIADDQFDRIMLYDYTVTFTQPQDEQAQLAFREELDGQLDNCVFAGIRAADAFANSGMKNVSVVTTDDPAITRLVDLHDGSQELGYPTGEGAFVSSKLAKLAGVQVGDTIRLQLDTKELVELPVTGIFDNYVNHFIYLTAEGYEAAFGEPVEYSAALAQTSGDVYAVAASLQSTSGVASVTVNDDFRAMVDDTMVSLDAVIVLVVGCAVALSFVVSYNLCNINITERQREIATIKVLGFYPGETYSYVFRESVVLTGFGAVVGIPLGIWLHRFVLSQIQVDMVSFRPSITWLSFVLALVITFAINAVVNLLLQKKIDQIHMAESLKSVE